MPKDIIVSDFTATGNVDWNQVTGFGISLDANKSYRIGGILGFKTANNTSYKNITAKLEYTGTNGTAVCNAPEELKFMQNKENEGFFDTNGAMVAYREFEVWMPVDGIIKTTSVGNIELFLKMSGDTADGIILEDSYLEFTEIV